MCHSLFHSVCVHLRHATAWLCSTCPRALLPVISSFEQAYLGGRIAGLLTSGAGQQQTVRGASVAAPLYLEWHVSHSPVPPHHPSAHQAPGNHHASSQSSDVHTTVVSRCHGALLIIIILASTDVFDQVTDNPGTSVQPSWLAEDVKSPCPPC